jgi:hypothetical protein
MATAHPAPGRPLPATPVARARRQPAPRPRQWGRPLTVGLALVLVAALVPGARADDGGDGGLPPAVGSVGDQGVQAEALQGEASANTFEDQPAQGTTDPAANVSADRIVLAESSEATGSGGLPPERPQQDPALSTAEQRQEGQPPNIQQSEADTDDPLREAEQLAQRFDTSQECAGDGGCQEEPGIPRVPLLRGDTRGGTGPTDPGGDPPADRQPPDLSRLTPQDRAAYSQERQQLQQQAAQRLADRHAALDDRELARIQRDLDALDRRWARHAEETAARAELERARAAGEAPLPPWDAFQERLERVEGLYESQEKAGGPRLRPREVAEQFDMTVGQATTVLRTLRVRDRIEPHLQRLRDENLPLTGIRLVQIRHEVGADRSVFNRAMRHPRQPRQESPESPQGGQSQMRAIGPEDVAGTSGGQLVTEQDKQLVTGPTGGHTGLSEQEQQALNQVPGHPGLTEQEQRDLQTLPGTPLTKRNPRDLQLPGTPLTDEQPDAHTHLATATDGATSDQTTTTGRLARLAATATEWAPAGLAVLLAAMLTVGCKGAPCSSMLRPAFRGFQGAPGQVVPGHLQG